MVRYPVVVHKESLLICVLSSPFSVMNIFPVGGRSTAIKLRNGDVWVLASTPLNEPTKAKLREMGPVKYAYPFQSVQDDV